MVWSIQLRPYEVALRYGKLRGVQFDGAIQNLPRRLWINSSRAARREPAIANDQVRIRSSRPSLCPVSAGRRSVHPDNGRYSRGPGDRSEYRLGPRRMEDEGIEYPAGEQLSQLVPGTNHCQRPAHANGSDGVGGRANTCQFMAQPAFKAKGELLLHVRAGVPPPSQRRQHCLYAAVHVSAMNVKYAHQFHAPASLR